MSTTTAEVLEDLIAQIDLDHAEHKPGCINGSIIGQDELTGRVIVVPCCCKSWTCPACAQRLKRMWAKRAVLGEPDRFLTWTVDPKLHPDPHEARVAIQKAFTSFVAHWRKGRAAKGDKHAIPPHELEYISVWERHKSGFPHLHALIRGDYIPQSYIRAWSIRSGCGSIVHIKAVENVHAAVSELLKYVTKAAKDVSEFFTGFRLLNMSRKYCRDALPEPTSENTPAYTWEASDVPAQLVVDILINDLDFSVDPKSLPGRMEFIPGSVDVPLEKLRYKIGQRCHFSP